MPEIVIEIGGRDFTVACQDGEEGFLRSAAAMLDAEAGAILEQVGRMPTDRMLLMAGLMLADKAAGIEEDMTRLQRQHTALTEKAAEAEEQLTQRARQIADLQDAKGPETVAVIPTEVQDHLAELAARAEALADELEAEPGSGSDDTFS